MSKKKKRKLKIKRKLKKLNQFVRTSSTKKIIGYLKNIGD